MASLFVDVHPSKAKQTLFRIRNCFLIASTVSAYSIQQMLLRVVADGRTRSSRNAFNNRGNSRFDIVFHGICAETNPNMREQFHVSWWNSEDSKSLAPSLKHFVCHFGQYGSNWISNMIYLCKLTIVIPRLPCLFRMAKAVSSTVELVNSVTSDSVNSFNFVMWLFASKCFPNEVVSCSDGWRRTWWQMIHMMPGLPGSLIPSVSNGSKIPVQCRVRFQPGTGPLQRVSTQNPLLKSQHFLLQLSIGVLIVSRHNLYVKYAVWFLLSSPVLRVAIGSIVVETRWKPGHCDVIFGLISQRLNV